MNAKAYNKEKLILWSSETVLNIILLVLFISTGLNQYLSTLVKGFNQNVYAQLLIYVTITGVVSGIIFGPLSFYGGFLLEKKFQLSEQTIAHWLKEKVKGLLVGLLLGLPLLLIFFYILRSSPDYWWAWLGAVMFFFSVILSILFPVLILPVFYKQQPIHDTELLQRIYALVSVTGMKIKTISEFDMSKNTRKGNAMLTGLGKTKRVLLGDTLIKNFTIDEIETVLAHEFGHSYHGHIWKNVVLGTLQSFAVLWLISVFYAGVTRYLGYQSVSDLSALPLLVLISSLISLLQNPLFSAISRKFEYQADAFAVKVTGKKEVFISTLEKLNEQNLGDSEPHPFIEWYMYSHPSLKNRKKALLAL